MFIAAITEGLNIVREIKPGLFIVLLSWCWYQCCHQPLHLCFSAVSEVEGAAGPSAMALCGTHSSAAGEGRAGAAGNSADPQPSLEEVTALVLFVVVNV